MIQKIEFDFKPYDISKIDSTCLWDRMSEEDRNKPMCLSCPCPRCSPYSLNVSFDGLNHFENVCERDEIGKHTTLKMSRR